MAGSDASEEREPDSFAGNWAVMVFDQIEGSRFRTMDKIKMLLWENDVRE